MLAFLGECLMQRINFSFWKLIVFFILFFLLVSCGGGKDKINLDKPKDGPASDLALNPGLTGKIVTKN